VRFDQDAAPLAPGMERTRTEYRAKSARDLTPAFWVALAVGALVGVSVGLASGWRLALSAAPVAFLVVFIALGLYIVLPGGVNATHVVEVVTRLDLDGDGVVGAPPPREYVPVRLDVTEGTRHRLLNLEITREMGTFASRLLVDSVTFSEAGAGECGVDVLAFRSLRDQLLERGLLAWKNEANPRSGYVMRRGYHQVLRQIVDHSPTGGDVA